MGAKEWLASLLSRPESIPVTTTATFSSENAVYAKERGLHVSSGRRADQNGM